MPALRVSVGGAADYDLLFIDSAPETRGELPGAAANRRHRQCRPSAFDALAHLFLFSLPPRAIMQPRPRPAGEIIGSPQDTPHPAQPGRCVLRASSAH